MLEQRRHIGLIARDAVQRFGQHNVELATSSVLQQALDARPENDAGAGDGGIMKGIDDLPSLPACMLTTDAELVLDRRHALVVGRTAGVKHNLEHDVLSGSGLHIDSAISAAVRCRCSSAPPRAPSLPVLLGESDRHLCKRAK